MPSNPAIHSLARLEWPLEVSDETVVRWSMHNRPSKAHPIMHQLRFHCRLITPLFMGGAQGTPELRPPSIKGALLFWWRAMQTDPSIAKLKARQQHLFGGSADGGKKSQVQLRVRILHAQTGPPPFRKEDKEGAGYLWYSLFMNRLHGFRELDWEVIFQSHQKEPLLEAGQAFWLLAQLGGLGSRSRRGAGNFEILDVHSDLDLPFAWTPTSPQPEAYQSYLSHQIRHLIPSAATETGLSAYPRLSHMHLWLVPHGHRDAITCLDTIGNKFRSFRLRRQPDYREMKDFLSRNSPVRDVQRAEFGLPLMFRFRSVPHAHALISPNLKGSSRSASSLCFHISRIGAEYYALLTDFHTELLPPQTPLQVKGKARGARRFHQFSPPQSSLTSQFIQSLKPISIL